QRAEWLLDGDGFGNRGLCGLVRKRGAVCSKECRSAADNDVSREPSAERRKVCFAPAPVERRMSSRLNSSRSASANMKGDQGELGRKSKAKDAVWLRVTNSPSARP